MKLDTVKNKPATKKQCVPKDTNIKEKIKKTMTMCGRTDNEQPIEWMKTDTVQNKNTLPNSSLN